MGQSFIHNYIHIIFSTKHIANQKEHPKKKTFQDEYRAFLKKYQVEYDERYVWE